jgi:hypothetical protein
MAEMPPPGAWARVASAPSFSASCGVIAVSSKPDLQTLSKRGQGADVLEMAASIIGDQALQVGVVANLQPWRERHGTNPKNTCLMVSCMGQPTVLRWFRKNVSPSPGAPVLRKTPMSLRQDSRRLTKVKSR